MTQDQKKQIASELIKAIIVANRLMDEQMVPKENRTAACPQCTGRLLQMKLSPNAPENVEPWARAEGWGKAVGMMICPHFCQTILDGLSPDLIIEHCFGPFLVETTGIQTYLEN